VSLLSSCQELDWCVVHCLHCSQRRSVGEESEANSVATGGYSYRRKGKEGGYLLLGNANRCIPMPNGQDMEMYKVQIAPYTLH